MTLSGTLFFVIAVVCALWIIYDVFTHQKKMKTEYKVLWTIAAIVFSIVTAIVYYFIQKNKGGTMKKELLGALFVVVLLSACTVMQNTTPAVDNTKTVVVAEEPEKPLISTILLTKEEKMKNAALAAGYIGMPLAGETTFYLKFNEIDYDLAIANDKLIFINFYSTECTYCQEDNDAAIDAFNAMDYPDVVGFRVLFNDPELTLEDRDIALKYGVENLNTKVIIKGGKRVFKATDSWTKQTFIDEIERNRG